MDWPLTSDFSRMLQNPQVAFRDPELRKCRVEMDNLGQPKPRSGNFATVYKAFHEDGSEFAVRVFNRRANLRTDAYQAKSEYLKQSDVSSLVGFHYDEKGIRASDGKLYPLLTMDWVPGLTLFEWCRDRCHEGYKEALSIAAEVWLHLVRELIDNQIVHGDLQHGNVLVDSQGHIKLVDYDCMAVPELFGQTNFEIGMEPYQHPGRDDQTKIEMGLDNFSAIVIYVALRALAAAPELWTTFVDNPSYDKLLFRKEDFADPQNSPLYQQLLASPDGQVRDLAYYLFQLTTYPLSDVPTVDDVILWTCSVEDLLGERDWDRAVQLVESMSADEEVPAKLKPAVNKAYRRVECRKKVEAAFEAGDEWQVHEQFDEDLLDDYPAVEELVEKARSAENVARIIENLNTAKRFGRWSVLVEIWDKNRELLEDRPSTRNFQKEISKVRAAESVRRLLKDKKGKDERVLEAWKYLKSLGGHAAGEDLWPEVQQRVERQNRVIRLRKEAKDLEKTPSITSDKKFLQSWKSANLDGYEGAADLTEARDAAERRLRALSGIKKLGEEEISLARETKISDLGRDLPENYGDEIYRRALKARRRVKAHTELTEALKPPRLDWEIFKAYKKLKDADGKMLIAGKLRNRISLATRRIPLLKEIRKLSDDMPANELDQKLLENWHDKLLAGCRDVEKWRNRYELARRRHEVLEKMEAAIENIDKERFEELSQSDCLKGFDLPENIREGKRLLKERLVEQKRQRRQALVKSLISKQRGTFADLFDWQIIKDICAELPHHQKIASQYTEEEILPPDRCGLGPPVAAEVSAESEAAGNGEKENTGKESKPSEKDATDSDKAKQAEQKKNKKEVAEEKEQPQESSPVEAVRRVESERVEVRWQWPEPRVTNCCHVAICKKAPGKFDSPQDVAALKTKDIQRDKWDSRGRHLAFDIQPEWDNAHVVVWAVVDLGFQTFYSPPVELGTIQPLRRARKWGLFGGGKD